ncbi:MAG: hypothetical protein CL868_02405 [Cytophagaceae bacterium]|nr:hypothetical protein [Cytophagaceae bacterium]|tara:strand:- start:3293 stop:3898 length:606 start_codon:yes stop_codon:yes gene_type:complete
MKKLLKPFSYIFHPLFMPMLGVGIYFIITKKYIPEPFLYAKLFALSILTIIVPILFFFLLRNLGLIDSAFIPRVKQRRLPLLSNIALTFLVIKVVVNGYEFPELYYFFLGILITTIILFLLSLLKVRASLHMVGLSGVIAFVMGLSIHYADNLLYLLAVLIFFLGCTASSRLVYKAHTILELLLGLVIGILPQVAIFYYWL